MIGGSGADKLTGDANDNIINGGLGKDIINAGAGNDIIIYDAADTVDGGAGIDSLDASGQTAGVTIDLSAAKSNIKNIENLIGSKGADQLTGDAKANLLVGNDGDDIIDGKDGADILTGGAGKDQYKFGIGYGHDTITADASNKDDTIVFGAGITFDSLVFSQAGDNMVINLNNSTNDRVTIEGWFADSNNQIGQFQFSNGSIVRNISGTKENDSNLQGTNSEDIIFGLSGNDSIFGLAGNDYIFGGEGDDVIDGGFGNDIINGGAGDDIIIYDEDDIIDGGEGVDSLVASVQTGGITVDLSTASNIRNIENLIGGIGADRLTGDANANRLVGNDGDDILDGREGDDILTGGAGRDQYKFGMGYGHDTITADASNTDDTILLGKDITLSLLDFKQSGNDLVIGLKNSASDHLTIEGWFTGNNVKEIRFSDGSNLYYKQGAESDDTWLQGSSYGDFILGFGGNDKIYGLSGDDYIDGGDGDDFLFGGDGVDILIGGNGNDLCESGEGNGTQMYGGAGNDILKGTGHNYFSGLYLDGGDGDDILTGVFVRSHLYGGNGNDLLHQDYGSSYLDGGNGDDIIEAYSGDTLVGGEGNDIYNIYRNDAEGLLIDNYSVSGSSEVDTLRFEPSGFTVDAFAFERNGNDLVLSLLSRGNEIVRVSNWFMGEDYQIDKVIFSDNTTYTAAQITSLVR